MAVVASNTSNRSTDGRGGSNASYQPESRSAAGLVGAFIAGACRRHWLAGAVAGAMLGGLIATATLLKPPLYRVYHRVLALPAHTVVHLARPHRRDLTDIGAWPERVTIAAVAELMYDPRWLVQLIDDLDLVTRWESSRIGVGALKDWLRTKLRGPMPAEAKRDALAAMLGAYIGVSVEGDVIAVWADWFDPQTAVEVAKALMDRVVQERRAALEAQLASVVVQLETQTEAVRKQVLAPAEGQVAGVFAAKAAGLAEVAALADHLGENQANAGGRNTGSPGRQGRRGGRGSGARTGMTRGRGYATAQDPVAKLLGARYRLAAQRQRLRSLRSSQEAAQTASDARLAQLRSIFDPKHPDVVAATRQARSYGRPSPEAARLEREVWQLSGSIAELESAIGSIGLTRRRSNERAGRISRQERGRRQAGANEGGGERETGTLASTAAATPGGGRRLQRLRERLGMSQNESEDDDDGRPRVVLGAHPTRELLQRDVRWLQRSDDLRQAQSTYGYWLRLLRDARLEHATQMAGFDLRHVTTLEPLPPKRRLQPKPSKAAGLGLTVFALVFFGVVLVWDILRLRVVAPWQVRSVVGLPVLGELGTPGAWPQA